MFNSVRLRHLRSCVYVCMNWNVWKNISQRSLRLYLCVSFYLDVSFLSRSNFIQQVIMHWKMDAEMVFYFKLKFIHQLVRFWLLRKELHVTSLATPFLNMEYIPFFFSFLCLFFQMFNAQFRILSHIIKRRWMLLYIRWVRILIYSRLTNVKFFSLKHRLFSAFLDSKYCPSILLPTEKTLKKS